MYVRGRRKSGTNSISWVTITFNSDMNFDLKLWSVQFVDQLCVTNSPWRLYLTAGPLYLVPEVLKFVSTQKENGPIRYLAGINQLQLTPSISTLFQILLNFVLYLDGF